MFIPFTPHDVIIKNKDRDYATVIAIDMKVSIERCFAREKIDTKKLEDKIGRAHV